MTDEEISRSKKLPLFIRSALRDDAEDDAIAAKSGVAFRHVTSKLSKAANAGKVFKGLPAVAKNDSQLGGILPRHFDIFKAMQPPEACDLMTEAYLQSVSPKSLLPQRVTELPSVRSESSASVNQKSSLVSRISSMSNAMHVFKKFHQQSSSCPPSSNAVVNVTAFTEKRVSENVRDQVVIEICHSAGLAEAALDFQGDTMTSMILQVPKSFREKSVDAMRIDPHQSCDGAKAKLIADKHINKSVAASPNISGQNLPFPSDFLKPLNLECEPMSQMELDDPTILLLQGPGIALTHEVPLPEGCSIIQKHRKDGKIEIRIDLNKLPVTRLEAQKSMSWFLNEWKQLQNFDMDCNLSNVQTAWAVLSVSFMDVTRQNFLICKERGVHLQHLWVHISSFACRGITLAQSIARDFAASEVKYLQKIDDFEANFISEVDKLHKFYQKQLNLAWNTEERYKVIIMGLQKDQADLTAQLAAVHHSALYNELASLRTFYINFAENTKYLRDLVLDATSDWNKRASSREQRWKAQAAGEIESVEKIALTIGQSDQQDWELKLNEIFASKNSIEQESNSLKESNCSLTVEVASLRDQLEQALSLLKQSKLVASTSDFTQQVSSKDFEEDKVVEEKKKKHVPKVAEKEKIPQIGLGSLLSLKARPDKPNILGLSQLHKLIFELYDLKAAADKVDDSVNNFRQNMVQYFFEAYTNKFGLQAIADKQMWNFIASIQKHQSVSIRARLMGRFLGVVEPVLTMSNLNFFMQFRQRINEIHTGRKNRIYDEDSIGVSQMRILELLSKTFTRIKDTEREAFFASFLKGVRILNQNPESVSGDNTPDLDLDHVFERAMEYDSAEGKMRTDEAFALFDDFAKLDIDQRINWIQSSSRCSQEDATLAVEKMSREGDCPDYNSFIYATASVVTIRQAFFPLDAQVEFKVLAKIQVLLRKIPTISELWKKLSGKKEKMFPEDFQESMCKLGLNLSKMEILLFFCLWDEDADGFLSERELVLMMPVDIIETKFRNTVKKKIEKDNTSLQGIFRFFDKDGEGKISSEEFVMGCQLLQIGILDSQAAALFENWDVDGGGSVEYEEFKKCMDKDSVSKK